MNVLDYLNSGKTLDDLKEEFGIKVSQNPLYPDLYCLNYCQINSSKYKDHPIVVECRSLVLRDVGDLGFILESRSFDRFFNYGEIGTFDESEIQPITAMEKIDGSLISVWYSTTYNKVMYRTKSMIMPGDDVKINWHNLTWKELIESTINLKEITVYYDYMFEVVSHENRVVTKYADRKAYLLGVRVGHYYTTRFNLALLAEKLGVELPKVYDFNSYSECINEAISLPDLQEGFVILKDDKPVLKIKSPAYVAAHRLRGESTPSPKRIMDMIFINEHLEYLAIFPEDEPLFVPYVKAYLDMHNDFTKMWDNYKDIDDKKEFAMSVKSSPVASILFTMKKSPESQFNDLFDNLFTATKYKIVESYL